MSNEQSIREYVQPKGNARKPVTMASRFTRDESAAVDRVRGSLTRSEFLRWAVLKAVKDAK